MTRDELMNMAAEKAVAELKWESIEFLFRPSNGFELLLRLDFEGSKRLIGDFVTDDSPDAMPHRFRGQYCSDMNRAVEVEEFYRKIKSLRSMEQIEAIRYLVENDTASSEWEESGMWLAVHKVIGSKNWTTEQLNKLINESKDN